MTSWTVKVKGLTGKLTHVKAIDGAVSCTVRELDCCAHMTKAGHFLCCVWLRPTGPSYLVKLTG